MNIETTFNESHIEALRVAMDDDKTLKAAARVQVLREALAASTTGRSILAEAVNEAARLDQAPLALLELEADGLEDALSELKAKDARVSGLLKADGNVRRCLDAACAARGDFANRQLAAIEKRLISLRAERETREASMHSGGMRRADIRMMLDATEGSIESLTSGMTAQRDVLRRELDALHKFVGDPLRDRAHLGKLLHIVEAAKGRNLYGGALPAEWVNDGPVDPSPAPLALAGA